MTPALVDTPRADAVLVTPCLPEIRNTGLMLNVDPRTGPRLLVILGAQAVYAVAAEGATVVESLHGVAFLDRVCSHEGNALWQSIDASPVQHWEDFQGTVVLVHDSTEIPISLPNCHRDCLTAVKFLSYVDPARLFLREAVALQIGAGFPVQQFCLRWLNPTKSGSERGISIVFHHSQAARGSVRKILLSSV